MPKVRYRGRSDTRSFEKSDFQWHGIEDQDAVTFNHDNKWVAEVSAEAAGYLVGTGEFEKVTDEQLNQEAQESDSSEPQQQVPLPGEAVPGEKRNEQATSVQSTQVEAAENRAEPQAQEQAGEDYEGWTKDELVAEIEDRNSARGADNHLKKSGNKDELIEALRQDDEGQS